MIKLKTLAEHSNEYGDEPLKKVGKTYEAPERAAAMLIANKYCEDATPKAAAEKKES